MKKYVTYLRVSTGKQGHDGLGVEAQRAAVARFVGEHSQILNEYVEVESGAKDDRKQLNAAIAEAKASDATLLIAKLDRLSRNAAFIFKLRDTKVDFLCADMPDATPLTIGIFAVIAQNERELISQRTKAALAAKKARGEKIGTPANLNEAARTNSLAVRQEKARTHKDSVQVTDIIRDKRQLKWTYQRIAVHLTSMQYKTHWGRPFTACAVLRLARAANAYGMAEQVPA